MTCGFSILIYQKMLKRLKSQHRLHKKPRISATAEGPRDALRQLKSCQLLHSCTNKYSSAVADEPARRTSLWRQSADRPPLQARIKKEYLYSAIYYASIVSKRSDMDHTVLPANTPYLPFLRKRSPDGATPNWSSRHPVVAYILIYRPWRDERLSWSGW